MARILCIETATRTCSTALGIDGGMEDLREAEREHFSHAEELTLFIRELLQANGLGFEDLDGIAVGAGPGSYTGLRIGVSTAKGLAYASGIPLIGLRTLHFMASGWAEKEALGKEDRIVPMLDARRDEVYCTLHDGTGTLLGSDQALCLDADSFPGIERQGRLRFIGSGAAKARELLRELPEARFHPEISPSAVQMIPIAERAFDEGRSEDLFSFEPFYLKDFVPTTPKKEGG